MLEVYLYIVASLGVTTSKYFYPLLKYIFFKLKK